MALDPNQLADQARCIQNCIPDSSMQMAVLISLMAQLAGVAATTQADIQAMVTNASCYACIPEGDRMGVLVYLANLQT